MRNRSSRWGGWADSLTCALTEEPEKGPGGVNRIYPNKTKKKKKVPKKKKYRGVAVWLRPLPLRLSVRRCCPGTLY